MAYVDFSPTTLDCLSLASAMIDARAGEPFSGSVPTTYWTRRMSTATVHGSQCLLSSFLGGIALTCPILTWLCEHGSKGIRSGKKLQQSPTWLPVQPPHPCAQLRARLIVSAEGGSGSPACGHERRLPRENTSVYHGKPTLPNYVHCFPPQAGR